MTMFLSDFYQPPPLPPLPFSDDDYAFGANPAGAAPIPLPIGQIPHGGNSYPPEKIHPAHHGHPAPPGSQGSSNHQPQQPPQQQPLQYSMPHLVGEGMTLIPFDQQQNFLFSAPSSNRMQMSNDKNSNDMQWTQVRR